MGWWHRHFWLPVEGTEGDDVVAETEFMKRVVKRQTYRCGSCGVEERRSIGYTWPVVGFRPLKDQWVLKGDKT